ncbi:MAG: Calx-beta domain-containing protein [Methylococcales bacterium]|nr:Calx-beta domain-containing protein [Methylococcales bacterium]
MAKLFLESTDTSYKVSNSNTTVYGATGDQAVVIDGALTGVTVNSNVERVQFTGSTTDYTYKVVGTNLEVYTAAGALVTTVGVQTDTTGTQLTFANGTVDAKITGLNAATVGGQTVSATAATAVVIPTTAIDTTIASAPAPVFSVSAPVTSVTEAAGAVASYTISLNAAQPASSSVSFALGNIGTATTADYGTAALTAVTGGATLAGSVITFPAGITTATITVPVTVDALTETGEGVSLTLSAPSTGASVSTTAGTASVSIIDPPTPVFSLAASATAVGEGTPAVGTTAAVAAGTITLTVTRTGNTAGTDSVVVQATGGTGTNGAISASDFVALSQTVTFAPTETSKTVTFTTIADSTREGDETLTVSLGTPSTGASISTAAGASSVVLTITNDDPNLLPVITTPTTTPSAFISDSTAVTGISFTDGDDNTGFSVTVQAAGSSQVSFSNFGTNSSITAKNAANTPMYANETSNTITLSGTKADLNTTLASLKYTTNSTVPTSEQVVITITDSAGGVATKTLPINIGTSGALTTTDGDSLTGSAGDDIFSGTLAKFQAGDKLIGSTGTDKLTLTSVDGALPTLTTAATGIEVLDLTADISDSVRTVSFSAVNFGTSLTTVNFTTNTAAGTATVPVADVDTLTATTANAGTTFNIQNSAGVLNISAINGTATTADAFTVNLAGGVTLAGIAQSGNASVIDVLNINSNGSSANTITSAGIVLTAATNPTINVAGTQAITLGTLPDLGTGAFNGANASGKISVTANAADSAAITGGSAGDALTGNAGLDTISGGAGNDTIDGGAGVDSITGGTGVDSLTGGAGNDVFVFAVGDSGNTSTTRDTLADLAEGDIIKFGTALTGLTNGATLGSTGTVRIDATNKLLVVGTDEINIPTSVANAAFTYSYGADSVVGTADDYITVGAAPFTATNNALGTLTLTGKAVATSTVVLSDSAPTVGGNPVGNNAVRTVDASTVTNAGISVTGSTGADKITFASGNAVVDTFVAHVGNLAALSVTSGTVAIGSAISTGAVLSTSNADVITNFGTGDTIQVYTGTSGTTTQTYSTTLLTNGGTPVDLTGSFALVKGTYSATANTFTESTTGTSSALLIDTDGTTGAGALKVIILSGYVDAGTTDTVSAAGLFTVVA